MLRRNIRATALAFLALFHTLLASARLLRAAPQQAVFEISGEVRDDADEQPIPGARVQFRMTSELVVFPLAFTSPTGVFRLRRFARESITFWPRRRATIPRASASSSPPTAIK